MYNCKKDRNTLSFRSFIMDPNTEPGMAPIRISDASSMLRKRINVNERPYTNAIYKYNNSLVDEWHEKVLMKIADKNGQVRAGQVWGEWRFFLDGKTVPQFMKELEIGHVCRPTANSVDYWVEVFTKKSIEEIAAMGQSAVGHGWKLIVDETFIRSSIEKWEKVYKGYDDPMAWRKRAHNNPKLWAEDYDSPFWGPEELKDIHQKVLTVLKISVSPEQ